MRFEVLLILMIIGVQVYFFYVTFTAIAAYKALFPAAARYEIHHFTISHTDLDEYDTKGILDNLEAFDTDANGNPEYTTIPLLTVKKENPDFTSIREAINTYLLRNSKATPDFALLKDIAERNNDVHDEKISSTISVPLYLGLLGTFLGIVIGLVNISDVSAASSTEASNVLDTIIPTLLGGVRTAMIASLSGLFLTVLNSAVFLKTSRIKNAQARNDFYTFLQVELLPVVNSSMEGTFRSLQSNLNQFNDNFSRSLGRLDTVMNKNSEAILQQAELVEMLRTMDLTAMAKANVTVLRQLEKTTGTLVGFNEYLGQINSIFNNTHKLTVKINEFLERTSNLESLAEKAEHTTIITQGLMGFLQKHFSNLEKSEQAFANGVVDVNATLGEAIDSLKHFTEEKIAVVRAIEVREEERINNDYSERWAQLGNLKYLKELVENQKTLTELQKSQKDQLVDLKRVLERGNSTATVVSVPAAETVSEAQNDLIQLDEPNRLFRFLFMKKHRAIAIKDEEVIAESEVLVTAEERVEKQTSNPDGQEK